MLANGRISFKNERIYLRTSVSILIECHHSRSEEITHHLIFLTIKRIIDQAYFLQERIKGENYLK